MSLVSERGDFTNPAGGGGGLEGAVCPKKGKQEKDVKARKSQGKIKREPEKERQKEQKVK